MGSCFRCYSCRYMFFWCFLVTGYWFSVSSFAANSFTKGQSIRDGDTIVSAGQKFELGFFSPSGSGFRYVGVWYYGVTVDSVIWVANRDRPILGTRGVLTIGNDGNVVVVDGNDDVVWSSNVKVESSNSTAVLMDTGNLVLFDGKNLNSVLWESFQHPTDTFLAGMKIPVNIHNGERSRPIFSSWKSAGDPSPGNYTLGVDNRGAPQMVIWKGPDRWWRTGHWNGLVFTGVEGMRSMYLYGFKIEHDRMDRMYFTYTPSDSTVLIRFRLNWEGLERQERWNSESREWKVLQSHPLNECDWYNHCGPFGRCTQKDMPQCTCLKGFVPKDAHQWSRGNWSGGCVRRTKLPCEGNSSLSWKDAKNVGFVQVENVKLPDYVDYVGADDVKDCEKMCLHNCTCTAYAFVNGVYCMIWRGDLVDIQQFTDSGNTLFVRLAHSEFGATNYVAVGVAIVIAIAALLLACVSIWMFLKGKMKCPGTSDNNQTPKVGPNGETSGDFSEPGELGVQGPQSTGTELAMFNFNYVVAATNNFSNENKLGQGGFGHVYKGTLPGGQEIAVKRLSKKSGQGLEEFKNEIMVIAKLQHRNLVRLLGCCIQGEEKILLYEYMPNKSLDSCLFDPDKKSQLDWSIRFRIIEGIARGLLYLHRDSRLRIIHRDLKASNILLDEEMNPKISDFGMARIFGGNQNAAATNRVVGTYGYMAPEYAMEGLFSLKSDVYSFGVLLLEIIMGRKNTSFRSSEHSHIIGFAWDLWAAGRTIDLIDPSIVESCNGEQVERCVQVGMLCVQDMAAHRPNMPAVVLMLEGESVSLPMPRQPTFTSTRQNLEEEDVDMWNGNQDAVSSNNVTISTIIGR